MKKLTIILLLIATAGIAGLVGCNPTEKSAQKAESATTFGSVRLNIPFPAIDFAPFYVAKNKGWLEESLGRVGAKPEILPSFGSIPTTYESLEADRVDMVMSSEVPPMINRANGKDVRIVWLSCTLKSEVAVLKASNINDIRALKGKKVGTLSGSDAHLWLIRNLLKNGMSLKDVTFLNLSPPDGKAAFNTGQIDAWAMFPPFSTQELLDGTAKVVAGVDSPIQVVLVSRGSFSRDHKTYADAVIEALERAKQWIIANPAEAQAIVAKETNLSIEVVRFAWPNLLWESSLNEAMVTQMQGDADFLESQGLIRTKLNVRADLLVGR
jgi:sulfonate transport system substrate-binding protein